MPYKHLFDLKNKTILVVGAAGGLAQETCLGLAQFGAKLALADISSAGLEIVTKKVANKESEVWSHVVDVTDEGSVRTLTEGVRQRFGGLDVMINFVGVASRMSTEDLNVDEFQRVVDINLKGSFLLAKHSLSLMLPKRSGKLILTGSVSAYVGRPFGSHYAASKGGVHAMVRSMAVETANRNIQINSIAPVFSLTEMTSKLLSDPEANKYIISTIPMGRLGLASDLVGAMIFLASRASDFITGQTIFVDGGCTVS